MPPRPEKRKIVVIPESDSEDNDEDFDACVSGGEPSIINGLAMEEVTNNDAEVIGQMDLTPRYKEVTNNKRMARKLWSGVDPTDGTLRGDCTNTCPNRGADFSNFAPTANRRCSAGKHTEFMILYDSYKEYSKENNATMANAMRSCLDERRTSTCQKCRDKDMPTVAEQKCMLEWDRLRKDACRRNNGCHNQNCPERGMASWVVIQADHGTNPNHRDKKGRVQPLGNPKYWTYVGGVPAMREEAKKIQKWVCGTCHQLEPTSSSGNVRNPDTMTPKPGQSEADFRKAVKQARISFAKYEYVNQHKRKIGACQYPDCGRPVLPGQEQSFDFDHTDPSTKRKCVCVRRCCGCADKLFRHTGGVSGLANNGIAAAALEFDADNNPVGPVKEMLDAEMDKCRLLCHGCHFSRVPKGIKRREEYVRPPWRERRPYKKRKIEADSDDAGAANLFGGDHDN